MENVIAGLLFAIACDIVRRGEELNPPQIKLGAKPGRCKQSDAYNLLRGFRLYADAILRFIADPSVPFTNNSAERAVRMPKIKQKISGCFRTTAGADNFCTIRSCLDTDASKETACSKCCVRHLLVIQSARLLGG
jgi:transposase